MSCAVECGNITKFCEYTRKCFIAVEKNFVCNDSLNPLWIKSKHSKDYAVLLIGLLCLWISNVLLLSTIATVLF